MYMYMCININLSVLAPLTLTQQSHLPVEPSLQPSHVTCLKPLYTCFSVTTVAFLYALFNPAYWAQFFPTWVRSRNLQTLSPCLWCNYLKHLATSRAGSNNVIILAPTIRCSLGNTRGRSPIISTYVFYFFIFHFIRVSRYFLAFVEHEEVSGLSVDVVCWRRTVSFPHGKVSCLFLLKAAIDEHKLLAFSTRKMLCGFFLASSFGQNLLYSNSPFSIMTVAFLSCYHTMPGFVFWVLLTWVLEIHRVPCLCSKRSCSLSHFL